MLKIIPIAGGSLQTNAYIIEDNKNILVIDYVPEIEKVIIKNNYTIDKLILTHIHFDHIEGLADFQRKYSFELGLSEHGYKNINDPNYNLLCCLPQEIWANINKIDLTNANIYKDNDIIIWKNHKIDVINSPGHSQDSMMYILKEAESVFTGDTIFKTSIGRTDLHDGDYDKIINSINNLFFKVSEDYTLYPGHGPKTSVSFEKKNNPFLKK